MSPLQPPTSRYYGEESVALYIGRVRVTGGEAGHGRASGVVKSDDGALEVHLRKPIELGGPGGGSNPEQLLAAGHAACLHDAVMLLADRAGIELTDLVVDAAVTFARDPMDGFFQLSADIRVRLPGLDCAVAAELVRSAERICPYTKMLRHGIDHVVAVAYEPESQQPRDKKTRRHPSG